MAANSKIEWTDATVNFWWGCTKVGPGCDHCYAETWSRRTGGEHWGTGVPRRKIKSAVTLMHRLDNDYSEYAADVACMVGNAKAFGLPVPSLTEKRRVFVQSMSDIFDLEVPIEWFEEAWTTIERCNRLALQIVTKRVSAIEKRLSAIGRTTWPKHAGLIITVVNQEEADRDTPRALALKAKLGIPWVGLSMEPLLGPVDLEPWLNWPDSAYVGDRPWSCIQCDAACDKCPTSKAVYYETEGPPDSEGCPAWIHADRQTLDWVIVGGESGSNARPMYSDWARSLRDQCEAADVAFHFKQWGEYLPVGQSLPGYGKVHGATAVKPRGG